MIRAVLFDAFGTLFRPRAPIHQQYAEIASTYGLIVQADDIKTGFRRAFKEQSEAHPLYGKHSVPPLHHEDWWGMVIERTFQYAHVADSDLQIALPTLLPELIEHFASMKGYTIHDDVMPCLQELQHTNLKLGIISNSDPRTMKVMESLGIVPEYISPDSITTSWEVGKAKPSLEIFQAAARKLGVAPHETLMVGDDLDEDYKGAREAGLQSVLLQRSRHNADYVRRENSKADLQGVRIAASLDEILAHTRSS